MAADAISISTRSSAPIAAQPQAAHLSGLPGEAGRIDREDADFLLDPDEIEKGREAARSYLESLKTDDARRGAVDALGTLATVFSGGLCDTEEFPWHQIRAYHGAAAIAMMKESGAPARIEALRCSRDDTRRFRAVPESFSSRDVQRIRASLRRVIEQSWSLGHMTEEERDLALDPKTAAPKRANGGRRLAEGEFRALVSACQADGSQVGARDALLFSLAFRGLKNAELFALTIDSLRFSNKTGDCTVTVKPARGGRGRRVTLSNDELICLEDWLEYRDRDPGPLLCMVKSGKIENKRLTTAALKEICDLRAEQAEVEPFAPNDLRRSVEAIDDHRKATRRRRARENAHVEQASILFDEAARLDEADLGSRGAAVVFPYGGLGS